MRFPRLKIVVLLSAAFAVAGAQAATSRSSWVVSQIYGYNHPFAATDRADLATKMSTMAASAFDFYRGTDQIFYQDMATLPPSAYTTAQTGYTWLGGDAHIGNFGGRQDSSGTPVFSVNDFDQGYLGQYVWDLRRLAASMVLAGRANGVADADITTAIDTMVGAYVDEMNTFQGSSAELSFALTKSNTSGVVANTIADSKGDTRARLLSKYTTASGSTRKFQNISGTLAAVDTATYDAVAGAMSSYTNTISTSKQYAASFYAVKDVHQKLGSGVGSLGELRYYVLVEGASTSTSDDVILELKQEVASTVTTVANGELPASDYGSNEGGRVAMTNKAQSLNADVLAGYTTLNGAAFYVHEKSPFAEDFDYTQLTSASKLKTAATYLGQALASAHAISDQDYNAAIVSYSIDKQVSAAVTSKTGLESEIATFGFNYAAQVNLDWQSFVAAYKAGAALY